MFKDNKFRMFFSGILSIMFLFAMNVYAQNDNNPAPSGSSSEEHSTVSEEAIGYWELNTSNFTNNPSKITKWSETGTKITGTSEWKDILSIIHTVSSSFKWDTPPERMVPGMELNLKGAYENNEYSTTGKIQTGIRIYIDKVGEPIEKPSYDAVQIVKLTKDYKSHFNEEINGKFSAPKYFRGKSNDIQVIVDCYIGTDHYVTTYEYDWVTTQ
jgi:hypothetical protein